jgi:predicted secreted protein
LGIAPAVLLLSALFTVWAGPLAAPAAGAVPTGVVVAWGANDYGATDVPAGLSGVIAIAAGCQFSLALKSDGTVVAWGDNHYGETNVPAGLSGVTAIAAGAYHCLALKSDRTVVAWGYDGDGATDVPTGLSAVTAISAGFGHSLAVRSNGMVVAWGYDDYGDTEVPAGLSGVTAVAAGGAHTLALKSDGTVVAWGWNSDGATDVPADLEGVTAIAAGEQDSLALKSDGAVVAWGANWAGQATVPAGLSGAIAIAAGSWHSLALVPVAPTLAVSGMTTPRVADSTGSIRVTAHDAAGKRLASYRGTIHFTSSDAAANLPANYTFTAVDNGTHVFVANVILRTAGTQSVGATDAAVSSITGVQSDIVVTPHVVTSLVTYGMTTPRIAASTGSIRVTALDAAGKRVYSYRGTVHFTTTDPQAILPADYTFKPADNGTHVFVANVILKTPGTWSVSATDTAKAALKGTQTGIVVQPPASKLVVSGLTTPRAAGSTGSIRVTATDADGNRVTYRGTVHFTSTDAQADLPANYTFTAADDGTHVFVANVILRTAGTWSVTATDIASASVKGSQTGIVVAPA